MSKHTPGPWKAGPPDGSYHDIIRIYRPEKSDGDLPVAVVPQQQSAILSVLSGETNETTEAAANGRLIAAAPDMYKALVDALEWMKRYRPPESHFYEITQVKAAIAKAEGQS